MQCKYCDYYLWNLTSGLCPECGTPFKPTDFDFVPNAVKFCCPHCRQEYYGTDERGHLVPKQFNCINCGHLVHMDEMLMQPATGVAEDQTTIKDMPWLDREKLGFWKGWTRTVGMSMVKPGQLIEGIDPDRSTGDAISFAFANWCSLFLGTVIISGIFFVFGGVISGGVSVIGPAILGSCIWLLVGFVVWVICLLVWGLTVHGILRLTGPVRGPINHTYSAMLYSSGPVALSFLPCINIIMSFWSVVSMIIMVRIGQNVGTGRAIISALAFPLLIALAYIGFAFYLISAIPGGLPGMGGGGTPFGASQNEVGVVYEGLEEYVQDHNSWPAHAAELVAGNYLMSHDLTVSSSYTTANSIPVGNTNLSDFERGSSRKQKLVIQNLKESMPKNVIAHRCGDFIFTYHGITRSTSIKGLWVVIQYSIDDSRSTYGNITVVLLNGTQSSFPKSQLNSRLSSQNKLRMLQGLAELPPLEKITQKSPALSTSVQSQR